MDRSHPPTRGLGRTLRRAASLGALLSMLAACGGGGDSGGNGGSGSGSGSGGGGGGGSSGGSGAPPAGGVVHAQRQSGSSHDLDGNGIVDAVETLRYDSEGRVVEVRYTYTGDGTPDLDPQGRDGNELWTISYDAQGRPATQQFEHADGTRTTLAHSYGADDALAAVRYDSFDEDGTPTSSSTATVVYAAGRVERMDYRDGAGTLIRRDTLSYGADGRPSSVLMSLFLLGTTQTHRTEYEWNADGTLRTRRLDASNDGTIEETLTPGYIAGRQVTTDVQVIASAVDRSKRYTFVYDGEGRPVQVELDLGPDGGVDTRIAVRWEAGPCRALPFAGFIPLVRDDGYASSANGHYALHCAA